MLSEKYDYCLLFAGYQLFVYLPILIFHYTLCCVYSCIVLASYLSLENEYWICDLWLYNRLYVNCSPHFRHYFNSFTDKPFKSQTCGFLKCTIEHIIWHRHGLLLHHWRTNLGSMMMYVDTQFAYNLHLHDYPEICLNKHCITHIFLLIKALMFK